MPELSPTTGQYLVGFPKPTLTGITMETFHGYMSRLFHVSKISKSPQCLNRARHLLQNYPNLACGFAHRHEKSPRNGAINLVRIAMSAICATRIVRVENQVLDLSFPRINSARAALRRSPSTARPIRRCKWAGCVRRKSILTKLISRPATRFMATPSRRCDKK